MPDAELSILFVDDAGMAELNKKWRGKNYSTNVLSFSQPQNFPQMSGHVLLGDVVISLDTARREASSFGVSIEQRVESLIIHGLVHILGEDHELGEKEAERMARKEKELTILMNKEKIMADLCVNVDHVATIRQARGGVEPDPVAAACMVELAGADGIVVHLREDRRHIQDRDVRILREIVQTRLVLEMAATSEMIKIASDIKPDIVTLVPEKRQELTTEGGLDVARLEKDIKKAVGMLHDAGIPVTIFVDPEEEQIKAVKKTGADCIEIHTGRYAEAKDMVGQDEEFGHILNVSRLAESMDIKVHAGHGLNYRNTGRLAALSEIVEFSIGHSIISKAVIVGIDKAVKEMLSIIRGGFAG
jgi:pyridoxine 5-phosphate synthase